MTETDFADVETVANGEVIAFKGDGRLGMIVLMLRLVKYNVPMI